MSSRKLSISIGTVAFGAISFLLADAARLAGYEIYIYRQLDKREAISLTGRLALRGEFFGQLLSPSTFPSYNDLTGPTDRWNMGFQDYVLITPTTTLLAQLVTHDRGGERTKFDWHFSLRQELAPNFVLILGHDSDHDSDHASDLAGKRFYTNRNYVGVGAPFGGRTYIVVEPFLRFFHHTNQPTHLDLSGEKLKQEYGLRVGARLSPAATLSLQAVIQSGAVLGRAEAWLADLIIRFRLTGWLEGTVGGGIWADWGPSPAGQKKTFTKLIWGIAVPF
jgi:hypothetical protein